MFSEANSLKSRSLNGKFTNVVSLLVRILDSENRFRSVIAQSKGGEAGRESLEKQLVPGSRATNRQVYRGFSFRLLPSPFGAWSSVTPKPQFPTLGVKDTEHQDLWEPLDRELLYTTFSGSAAAACGLLIPIQYILFGEEPHTVH